MDKKLISYQLFIILDKELKLTIGKLGSFDFPSGRYIYTGSAKKDLDARIFRHFKKTKPINWHIDYLLVNPHSRILNVKRFTEGQCHINQMTSGKVLIPRFGTTDCNNGCQSHLKYIE